MRPSEDVSLFIGILPGAEQRQVVLFPDGHVLADVRDEQIEIPGYRGSDHGMIAASALIGVLRDSGWYVDEMAHAAAVWMKPAAGTAREDVSEIAGASP